MRFKALAAQCLPRFDLLLAASAGEARLIRRARRRCRCRRDPERGPASAHGRSFPRRARGEDAATSSSSATWATCRISTRRCGSRRAIWPRLRSTMPFPIAVRHRRTWSAARSDGPRQGSPASSLRRAVDDAAPLYRRAALAVVPIRAGGGTRIKLLESASYGVPVVATRFGAAGNGLAVGT